MNISAISSNFASKIAPKAQNNGISFRANYSSYDEFVPTIGISSTSSEWRNLKKEGTKLASKSFEYLQQARAAQIKGINAQEKFFDVINDSIIQKENYINFYNEATELLKEARDNNFETIKNNSWQENGYWSKREVNTTGDSITITEYDDEDEDEVTKKIIYTPTTITYEDVHCLTGYVDRYVMDINNGQLKELQTNLNRSSKGAYCADREYIFDKYGQLETYKEGCKKSKHDTISADTMCVFANGRLLKIFKNLKINTQNDTKEAKQLFRYGNGVLKSIDEDYSFDEYGLHRSKKQYMYNQNGTIDAVLSDTISFVGTSASKVYSYVNNVIKQIQVGYRYAGGYGKEAQAEKIFKINPYMQVESCVVDSKGKVEENHRIENVTSAKKAIFI